MSSLAVFWVLASLFGGLFGSGDGDCRSGAEQAVRTMRQIGEQWPLRSVDDPVSDYVQRIGLRLARVIDPGLRQPWDFYVLRNAEPSALAVGGGHFVISDGLLAFVRDESELAAVLAHEISHQSLGHFCRGTSPAAERINRGAVVQHYDRAAEMDADRESIHLLAAAGFDAGAMESVLNCLERLPSTTGSHLSRRVQALTKQGISGDDHQNARSAAFTEVQSSVMKDLGNAAFRGCR